MKSESGHRSHQTVNGKPAGFVNFIVFLERTAFYGLLVTILLTRDSLRHG